MTQTSTATDLIPGRTVHPSSILRIREEEDRKLAREQLADDLVAGKLVEIGTG